MSLVSSSKGSGEKGVVGVRGSEWRYRSNTAMRSGVDSGLPHWDNASTRCVARQGRAMQGEVHFIELLIDMIGELTEMPSPPAPGSH